MSSQHAIYMRGWRLRNLSKSKEIAKRSRQKNIEKAKIREKKYRESHKEKAKSYMTKYYRLNQSSIKAKVKSWRINNPEKVLEQAKKHYLKNGLLHNLPIYKYKYALTSWASLILKRDQKCQICGSSNVLESHHIFSKTLFPQLTFNINNGILLCQEHHKELHSLNDGYRGYKLA